MYRIKLTSGDEANYGSIDELAQAVKAGTVTDTAAIYHARAEKWLPIASHPHFKMARDRAGVASRAGTSATAGAQGGTPRTGPAGTNGSSGVRPAASGQRPAVTVTAQRPAVTASGQRPAIGASGQRPSIGTSAQRPAAPGTGPQAAVATSPRTATSRSASPAPSQPVARQSTAERPARAPVVERHAPEPPAPRPAAEAPAPATDAPKPLDLLRADAAIEQDSAAPSRLRGVELEQTPTIEEPQVVTPAPSSVPIEQVPEPVHLVSAGHAPATGGIELIHPDHVVEQPRAEVEAEPQSAPAIAAVEVAPAETTLDIPAPVRDFAPADPAELHAVGARSRAPLYIGLGLAAAAAIGALVFLRKPASPAPEVTETRTAPSVTPAAVPASAVGAAESGRATGAPTQAAVETAAPAEGQPQASGTRRRRDTEPDPNGADGLEPPPQVEIPAAPSVRALSDAAALPSVDAAAPDLMDRKKALEQTVREIDSSMRRETGKSGGSTR